VRATGLTNVDDFAFTGNGNQVLTALFGPNQVVLVGDGLPAVAVLLRDKSSVAIVDSTRSIVHWED